MLRQLLTALAILTGLVSAGAPAQASATEIASVRLVAAAEASAAQAVLPSSVPAVAVRLTQRMDAALPCARPSRSAGLPGVVLKADRALE